MILVILVIFPISGHKEKNFIIMKKNFVQKKLNFGLLPKYIARLGSWVGCWARLLGVQALGRRWARRRTCVGARARAQVGVGERKRWGARQGERARVGLAGARGARGGERQAQAGARGAAGWAAWARPGRVAGPGWVFGAPDSVFGLV